MAGFRIEDWMMGGGLGLKGCELLVFAIIFSYSRGSGQFFGSEGSLALRTGYSRKQIGEALERLRAKGLLVRSGEKHPERQTYDYMIEPERLRTFVTTPCEETSQGDEKKVPMGLGRNFAAPCNLSSHNNNSYKDNYSDNYRDNDKITDNSDKSEKTYNTSNTDYNDKHEQRYSTGRQQYPHSGARAAKNRSLAVGAREEFCLPDKM